MISHLYRRPKKEGVFWFDARDDEHRWRESLETRDRHEAEEKLRERLQHLEASKTPVSTVKSWRQLNVTEAITRYANERRAQVSPRMMAFWKEQIAPLANHFGTMKLKQLTPENLTDYQNAALDAGKAPKTINNNLGTLRQVLKHCKLLYRFADYKPIPNNKPPVGRAISEEEQQRLFETASLWKPDMPKLEKVGKDGKTYKIRPDWMFAYGGTTLSFFLGLRSVEIRHLQWKDVDFDTNVLDVRRSKTPKGWRAPSLNEVCRMVLLELYDEAKLTTGAEPEHYVFPFGGTDPTRPMRSWRTAWRSLRKAAGLEGLRTHDGRHTAITTMDEKGVPANVIEAQVGQSKLLKDYLHHRRHSLNAAAAALEPTFMIRPPTTSTNEAEMVN